MSNAAHNGSSQHPRRLLTRHERECALVLKLERALDQSGFRQAQELRQQLRPVYRAQEQSRFFAPFYEVYPAPNVYFTLKRQQEEIFHRLNWSLAAFRRQASFPSPPAYSNTFVLEAKEAWERFYEGDTEPLDFFTKGRLGIASKHEGQLPDEVRSVVINFLDSCFVALPLYQAGDFFCWGLEGAREVYQMSALLSRHIKGFEDLKVSLSGDNKTFRERLNEELPGALLIALREILQTVRIDYTLLNAASNHLRQMTPVAAEVADQMQKKPYKLLEGYTDAGKRNRVLNHHLLRGGDEDDDSAQFEARETAQQQVTALPRWVERASFSMRERTVYEFDSKVGIDFETIEEATQAAAEHMNVNPSTVRTYRERYRRKLPEAAKA